MAVDVLQPNQFAITKGTIATDATTSSLTFQPNGNLVTLTFSINFTPSQKHSGGLGTEPINQTLGDCAVFTLNTESFKKTFPKLLINIGPSETILIEGPAIAMATKGVKGNHGAKLVKIPRKRAVPPKKTVAAAPKRKRSK